MEILERQPWHPISGSSELFINRNDDKTNHSWNKGTRSFVPQESKERSLCHPRSCNQNALRSKEEEGRASVDSRRNFRVKDYFFCCVIVYIKITHKTVSDQYNINVVVVIVTLILIFWYILEVGGSETIIWTKFFLSLHCSLLTALCNRRIINRFSSFFANGIIFRR